MENLTEKVYECTLAVEAHMVCDLLSQAGISARVEGEFLQTGGGELPLGNLVKVRVDPARAQEAREVIADWEKSQPAEAPAPVAKTSRFHSPLWFLLGAMSGGIVVFAALNTGGSSGVDFDGDGHADVASRYLGSRPLSTELDRNRDGKTDARWTYSVQGFEKQYENDDDFDGHFEWQSEIEDGNVVRSALDADGDGRPEQVSHFRNGVVVSHDYYFASGGRIVKREFYEAGLMESAEFDDDGDGVFERRVRYDARGEPAL
jgi:Putative prokaryotic signal transducing protein